MNRANGTRKYIDLLLFDGMHECIIPKISIISYLLYCVSICAEQNKFKPILFIIVITLTSRAHLQFFYRLVCLATGILPSTHFAVQFYPSKSYFLSNSFNFWFPLAFIQKVPSMPLQLHFSFNRFKFVHRKKIIKKKKIDVIIHSLKHDVCVYKLTMQI